MDDLISCIKRAEGLRLFPYKDTANKTTIGWGRNLTDKGISFAEASQLLDNDINDCKLQLLHFDWYNQLDLVRQEVLIELCFNMGISKLLTFTTMISLISQGKYKEAASDLLNTLWAKQVGETRSLNISQRLATGAYS